MHMLLVGAVMFLASGIQGFLGFGYGMFAMGVLAPSVGLLHTAGLVNLTFMINGTLAVWTLWRFIEWRLVWIVLPTAFIGIPLGVWTLSSVDHTLMTRILGGVIVAGCVYQLLGKRPARPTSNLWAAPAGLASGTLTGALNIGGPPLVAFIYSRDAAPAQMKGTIFLIFIIMSYARLPTAIYSGQITTSVLTDLLVAGPAVVLGLFSGLALGRKISAARFRTISWLAFALLGVWLAISA